MRQAKPGDETVDLPVLSGGTVLWKHDNWMDNYASVLAGDKDKPETWRLGFVDKVYWETHTKQQNGQLFITLPK
jgi:hypothetical protein